MVSRFQWKPFWLATQRDPQNDWTATQNRVNYDVFAQAPLSIHENTHAIIRRGFFHDTDSDTSISEELGLLCVTALSTTLAKKKRSRLQMHKSDDLVISRNQGAWFSCRRNCERMRLATAATSRIDASWRDHTVDSLTLHDALSQWFFFFFSPGPGSRFNPRV